MDTLRNTFCAEVSAFMFSNSFAFTHFKFLMFVLRSRFKTFMDEKMAYGFLFLTMIELTDIYYPLAENKHKTGPNICSSYFQTVNSMHSWNSQEKEKHSHQLSAWGFPKLPHRKVDSHWGRDAQGPLPLCGCQPCQSSVKLLVFGLGWSTAWLTGKIQKWSRERG